MQRRILRLLVLMLLSISAVFIPLQASAETGVTITVGATSTLLDPTLVIVPVQITCDPMDVDYNQGYAELRQAVSKRLIAHGVGYPQDLIVCDGLPHENPYQFWADPSGPPFSKGDATVTINVYLCGSGFCQSGSSGVQVTRLTSKL